MLYIEDDNTIRLTRGDTARLSVDVTNFPSGEEYVITDSDTLTLTIKKRESDTQHLVQKVIRGQNCFHIEPSDTKDMVFGKYRYDVQLSTSSGDIYTIIEPSNFEILKEVTY